MDEMSEGGCVFIGSAWVVVLAGSDMRCGYRAVCL
jgi:hypothetical protein